MARSTSQGGPNIITDGLTLYLDAANTLSYPGSGTTWNNLSSNVNSGSLIGSAQFDSTKKAISLLSVSDYVNVSSNIKTIFNGTQNASLSCWINTSIVNILGTAALVFGFHGVGSYTANNRFAISYQNYNSIQKFFFSAENGTFSYKTKSYSIQGSWANIAMTYDGSQSGDNKIVGYVNGLPLTGLSTVGTLPTTLSSTLDNFNIGYGVDGNNTLISNGLAYNRTLSAAEILQNYNALKGRFGL